MRILHVVGQSHRRGAEKVALQLAEELDHLGHENRVVALTLALDGRADPELPPLVRRVRVSPDVRLLCALHLTRRVRAEVPDVIVAHGGLAAQVAVLCPFGDGPVLVWQRILAFPPEVWRPLRRRLWRFLLRRIDAAIALTQDEALELRQLDFGGPVWVIPNFRQPQRFTGLVRADEARRLREQLGVDADTSLVGFVGHLVEQKRPERAIEVLDRILECGQPSHLVVAGDGPLRPVLEREIRERGLGASVSMLGHRNDVERVFSALDLVLLTSDVEGIPGVAIEALMAGCPVVSYPLAGVDEVIEDGVNGVVLPEASPELMAQRVLALLQDEALRLRMGDRALQSSTEFSSKSVAHIYDARLSDLVATASRRLVR